MRPTLSNTGNSRSGGERVARRVNILRGLLAAGVVLVSVGHAKAGTISTFTDRPTFVTAVGGSLTVEDFTETSHWPITTGVLNSSTDLPLIGIVPGTIEPGVTYSTPITAGTYQGNFFNIDAGGGWGYSGGFLDGFDFSPRPLTIAFDSNVATFGFDIRELGGYLGSTVEITIHFASDADQTFSYTRSGPLDTVSFHGFQSTLTDITGATIVNQGFDSVQFDLDNFTFGGNPGFVVPEPSGLALVCTGLAGIAGIGCWKRRRSRLVAA